jgi:hypothetical protein
MITNFDNRNQNVHITQEELDKQQQMARESVTKSNTKTTDNKTLLYAGIGVGVLLLILLLND